SLKYFLLEIQSLLTSAPTNLIFSRRAATTIFRPPSPNPPASFPASALAWLVAEPAGLLEPVLPAFCRPPSVRHFALPVLFQRQAAPPAAMTAFPKLCPPPVWLPCRRANTRPRVRQIVRRSSPVPTAPCSQRRENSFRDSASD